MNKELFAVSIGLGNSKKYMSHLNILALPHTDGKVS